MDIELDIEQQLQRLLNKGCKLEMTSEDWYGKLHAVLGRGDDDNYSATVYIKMRGEEHRTRTFRSKSLAKTLSWFVEYYPIG